jgi:hypothetical protein
VKRHDLPPPGSDRVDVDLTKLEIPGQIGPPRQEQGLADVDRTRSGIGIQLDEPFEVGAGSTN